MAIISKQRFFSGGGVFFRRGVTRKNMRAITQSPQIATMADRESIGSCRQPKTWHKMHIL